MNTQTPLLSYLKATQFSNGSFENSPFQTSLILICLSNLKNNTTVQLIARNAISYLFSQKSLQGSWNYYDRSQTHPVLPDDLDDTAMALAAIAVHEPGLVTEEVLLSFVNNLIAHETREGGPYFTWIVPQHLRESWGDIDLVVNSTINFFLNQQKIFLEPLDTFLENAITHQSLESKYYSRLHHCFFLSRSCSSRAKKNLMKILVQLYPHITTPLDRSLFITTYLNLGGTPQKVSHDIARLSKLRPNHLSADPFYIEELHKGIPTYAGSQALTAAFILQALTTYTHHLSPNPTNPRHDVRKKISHVSKLLLQRFASAPKALRQDLSLIVEKMSNQEKAPEIFLLPFLWQQSLQPHYQKSFSSEQVLRLCVANVLGWIGFGIYDEVIDGEQKQHLIPLANCCVRELVEIFHDVTPPHHFETIKNILDTIDHANDWEQTHYKTSVVDGIVELPKVLPHYKNLEHLAHKSLGHGLGPIILTLTKKKHVRQFFIHYLIARQLNDDAHDWLGDLEQGILNPVSVRIIKRFLELRPAQAHINLKTDREFLQSLFWYEIIDTLVHEIYSHTKQARSVIKKLHIFKDSSIADLVLLPLEQSAHQALAERNSAVRFLEKYR